MGWGCKVLQAWEQESMAMVRMSVNNVTMGAHLLRCDVVLCAEILPVFFVFCQYCLLRLLGVATA